MGKVIVVSNQKGGVGKTTTATNLAASLGILGKKVCMLDLDTQANATNAFGFDDEELKYSVYDVMKERGVTRDDVNKVIVHTEYVNIDLLPADIRLADLDIEIINMRLRETVLKRIVEQIKNQYDYIVIDCPPSLGLVTLNALVAADSVIIPILMEAFSIKGIDRLARTIREVKEEIHPALEIEGILITQYEKQHKLTKQYEEELEQVFGKKIFETRIRRNVAIKKSQNPEDDRDPMPVWYYEKESTSAQDYMALAKEVIRNND